MRVVATNKMNLRMSFLVIKDEQRIIKQVKHKINKNVYEEIK